MDKVTMAVKKLNSRKHKLTESDGDLLLSNAQCKDAKLTDTMASLRWLVRKAR